MYLSINNKKITVNMNVLNFLLDKFPVHCTGSPLKISYPFRNEIILGSHIALTLLYLGIHFFVSCHWNNVAHIRNLKKATRYFLNTLPKKDNSYKNKKREIILLYRDKFISFYGSRATLMQIEKFISFYKFLNNIQENFLICQN